MPEYYFIFDSFDSRDANILISSEIAYPSGEDDYVVQEVPGRDGDVLVDNERRKSVPYQIPIYLHGNALVENQVSTLDPLKSIKGYRDLTLSWDPDYVYSAVFYERYDVTEVLAKLGKATLPFTCMPYKFLKSGLTESTQPSVLENKTSRKARPLITIKGTGNITLQIGTEKLTLKNVDGGIVIDVLNEIVTNLAGTAPAWDKVTSYPLPVIKPGKQSVLTTGTITELKIIPRYEVTI